MQKIKQLLFMLLVPPLSVTAVWGQQIPVPENVQKVLVQERIRLQHNQPFYAAGERVWYKVYLHKKPFEPGSNVLYVELLDARGQLLDKQRLILQDGVASGDLMLPDELPTGSYTLKAYTSWMKNYSAMQQFSENILVVNAAEVHALKGVGAVEASRNLQVQIFPEGGSLLAGVPSKVAVVTTNTAGIGIAALGTIEDETGAKVGSFQSDDTGVSVFELTAEAGKQYTVKVQASAYKAAHVMLPRAKRQGLALTVAGQGAEGVQVNIYNKQAESYTLLAETEGKVYFTHQSTAVATSEAVVVPYEGTGEVVRLLLLNSRGQVEAERLVAPRGEEVKLQVQTDRRQYGPRQKVTVTLQATSKQGAMLQANVAAGVASAQADMKRPLTANTIGWHSGADDDRYFLLQRADTALWKDVQQGRVEVRHEREMYVAAFSRDDVVAPVAAKYVKAPIDTAFIQALPQSVVEYAKDHQTRNIIKETYGITEPHAAVALPKLPVDKVFKLDDYVSFDNIEEAIREVTTNVVLRKKKGKYKINLLYIGKGTKKLLKEEPFYILDGVVLDDLDEILALKMNDVATFEVAWSESSLNKSNLGRIVDNGVFAVYTKSGEARERLKAKGYPVLFDSYTMPRNFVPASYAGGTAVPANIPDFRSLVYWEPVLQIDANGNASFSFYTSDQTGTFQVKVKGQTSEGTIISGNAEFQVQLAN